MLQGFYSKDGCWGSKGRSRERVVKCEGCRKRERNGPRETGGKRVIRREGWKRADVTRNDGARNVEKNESGGKARVEGRWWIGAPPCVAPLLSLSLWFPPPFSFSRLLSHSLLSLSVFLSLLLTTYHPLPCPQSYSPPHSLGVEMPRNITHSRWASLAPTALRSLCWIRPPTPTSPSSPYYLFIASIR